MKMVFEQFGFNKEVYGDASLVMEIVIRFLRVMETLNEKDEFYLTVSDFSDDQPVWSSADFSFTVTNSEKLAGGATNANKDLPMTIKYDSICFPFVGEDEKEEEEEEEYVRCQDDDLPFVFGSYMNVDLRIERDGKIDTYLRDVFYKQLAETFYEICTSDGSNSVIMVKATVADEEIFTSKRTRIKR